MSVQTSRAPGLRKKNSAIKVGLPQVNLLPSDVREKRSLAVVKRWLAVTVVLVVVVAVLAYVFAMLMRNSAQDRLAAAEAQTATLRAEERQYAEVPQVRGQISDVTRARLAATSTEILWRPYVDAVGAVLPDPVRIVSFTATGPSPSDGALVSSGLGDVPVASLSFEGQSMTLPDTSAMLEAVAGVPGLQNPWVSSVAVTEMEGVVFYTFSLTVEMTDSTLAQRFVEATEGN